MRGRQRKGPGAISGVTARPEQLDLVKKHRLVIRRLFLPEGSPERVGERTKGGKIEAPGARRQPGRGRSSLFVYTRRGF